MKSTRLMARVFMAVAALILATTATVAAGTEDAAAQSPDPYVFASPAHCGATGVSLGYDLTGTEMCVPAGYAPVTTATECNNVGGVPVSGQCGVLPVTAVSCRDEIAVPDGLGTYTCYLPVYKYSPGSATARQLSSVCIMDEIVQARSDVDKIEVGSQLSVGGVNYIVSIGGPGCNYGCLAGWDMNCDGKVGDFCPIEYNIHKATDLAACLDMSTSS